LRVSSTASAFGAAGYSQMRVVLQAGKRLHRRAQRQVRGEGVVHIGDTPRGRVVGHLLGRADATDAAAVDLHETDTPVVDQVARHRHVVGAFAAGEPHRRAAAGQGAIFLQGAGVEGLLQPDGARLFQRIEPLRRRAPRRRQISAPHPPAGCHRRPGLAGGGKVVGVLPGRAAPDRPPAELGCAKTSAHRITPPLQRLLRRVAEQQRGVWRLGVRCGVTQQFPHRLATGLAENVPQGHLDARESVGGLQHIHAVVGHIGGNRRDVGRRSSRAPQHRRRHRLAGAMRHRADEGRDRGQRRRLAFAETLTWPPALTRTSKASWLPSASVVTTGMDR
jgi:hypothetical protein